MASSVWQSTSDYPPDVVDVIQSLSTEISIRFIFYRVLRTTIQVKRVEIELPIVLFDMVTARARFSR